MSEEHEAEYSDHFILKLESIFGAGFLSPGGVEEVSKIIEGIDLSGRQVLDIGVGIGGPACLLVTAHGAAKVIGIDVEDPVLSHAARTVASGGLVDRVELRRVSPGRLPFDEESFDVVFSKDSILHIPDKAYLFAEIFRVLKPGGYVALSDWYRSKEPFTEEMKNWLEASGLDVAMTPIEHDAGTLEEAGFEETSTVDRNHWFAAFSERLAKDLRGSDHARLVDALGAEDAEDWIRKAEARAVVSAQGQLRPGHLRGRKPAVV